MVTRVLATVGILLLAVTTTMDAQEVVPGDTVQVVTLEDRARLCPDPNCGSGEHIARVPTDVRLAVQDTATVEGGVYCIRWFQVTLAEDTGWLSEFDTDAAPEKPRKC